MSQINVCLKRLFTVFNIFFAIIGGVIISLALLSQVLTNIEDGESLEGRTTGLIVLYVVGSVTMVIAILGAYGAHKESKVSLIVSVTEKKNTRDCRRNAYSIYSTQFSKLREPEEPVLTGLFTALHIACSVQKNPKPVVPNLICAADRSALENLK
ncbi:CD81 antigen [Larimichthys crocea]|uniref:Uncharacterized protein n=1 Tax=Larimichthys crocea TaxID=215358 RepID=A0ACD3Q6W7_LARCR|nr:CD81 antigen [Larimichthys crocea]